MLTQETEAGWLVSFHYDSKDDRYECKLSRKDEVFWGRGSNLERALLRTLDNRARVTVKIVDIKAGA